MNSPDDRTDSNAAKLQSALLEYAGAPGKYQLSLRQPALLFSSIRQVLQLAAGRSAGGDEQPANRSVMEAAAFFIRAALLFPGATHYAVMGLPARGEPVELKERYRLLMRLIHPDFAATHAQSWPSDAAVRVNRAYEVLSSPVLRAEYDEQLAAPAPQRAAMPPKMDARPAARSPKREDPLEETGSWRLNRAAVWVLAGAGSLVGVMALVPWQGPDQLVQKVDAHLVPVAGEPARAQAAASALPPAPPQAVALASPPPAAPQAPAPAPAAASVHVAPPAARTVAVAAVAPAPAPRAEPPLPPRAGVSLPAIKPQPTPPARANPPAVAIALASRAPLARPVTAPEAPRAPERQPEAPLPAPVAQASIAMVATREEPARPAAAAAHRPERAPGPTGTEPSLNDAQPLLTQLLQSMEGGSGEQILRLLESDARRAPAAVALSRQYDQLVGQARPVRLSHVEFRSEAREGVLLVTGKVRLHAGNPTIGAYGERMSLRAEFVSRGGKVMLTGLSSATD